MNPTKKAARVAGFWYFVSGVSAPRESNTGASISFFYHSST